MLGSLHSSALVMIQPPRTAVQHFTVCQKSPRACLSPIVQSDKECLLSPQSHGKVAKIPTISRGRLMKDHLEYRSCRRLQVISETAVRPRMRSTRQATLNPGQCCRRLLMDSHSHSLRVLLRHLVRARRARQQEQAGRKASRCRSQVVSCKAHTRS